jgi:ATP-dependent helicase HepA
MLREGMYVRCPVDAEDMEQPRDFAMAKITSIDSFSDKASVHFYDCYGIRDYYKMPDGYEYPVRQLLHAQIHKNAVVCYLGTEYIVHLL